MAYIDPQHAIVVSTDESGGRSPSQGGTEDLCLVKVYPDYKKAAIAYWEPKTTTKTLASVVFRYYRHVFRQNPWQVGESSLQTLLCTRGSRIPASI